MSIHPSQQSFPPPYIRLPKRSVATTPPQSLNRTHELLLSNARNLIQNFDSEYSEVYLKNKSLKKKNSELVKKIEIQEKETLDLIDKIETLNPSLIKYETSTSSDDDITFYSDKEANHICHISASDSERLLNLFQQIAIFHLEMRSSSLSLIKVQHIFKKKFIEMKKWEKQNACLDQCISLYKDELDQKVREYSRLNHLYKDLKIQQSLDGDGDFPLEGLKSYLLI